MKSGEGTGVFNFDTTPDWANLRARAIDAFDGELPNAQTEQLIIEAYELHPEAVTKAVSSVAGDLSNGKIRTGWGVLKKRAERILAPPSNPSANTGIDKERAVARAEQWIKTCGCHFDRSTEILEELFGDRGLLREYAQIDSIETGRNSEGHAIYALSDFRGDLALVDRMTHLWDQHRPAGITIEEDANARAAKYREHQAALNALKAQVQAAQSSEPDLDYVPLPDADYAADPEEDPVPA